MSDVLVKDIEMPKICAYCFLDASECDLHAEVNIWRERHPNCPLIELPPHGRLIDADKLVRDTIYNKYITETILSNAPTVIEAEGSEE